jgi:tetratricopeptide (TPR) repeat protein
VTVLIGRVGELDALDRHAAAAAAGAGGLIIVEGGAGIGKTSLLDTFAAHATERHSARVLRGRAWEEGGAPPYWPWNEVARAGGWPVDWERHDNPFALYSDVLAVARFAARSGDGPLVLIIDDLHAADDDTIRLTRYIAQSVSDAPIALVAAARPNNRLAAITRLGSTLLLSELGEDHADELITSLAPEPLDDATRARIRAAAEGVPLFLGALARSAVTGLAVPLDIVSIVTPMIDRQDEQARSLVELAAVLGRSFPAERLAVVSGRPLLDVLIDVEPLRTAGILSIGGTPPAATFSHQLVRDVLYDGLPPARRLGLHAAVANAIDPELPDVLAERAHHLLAAVPIVDPVVAVAAARRAADHARSRTAFSDAASLLQRASDLTTDSRERYDLQLLLGACLLEGGHADEAFSVLKEAVDTSRELGDPVAFANAVLARTELVGWNRGAAVFLPLILEALSFLDAQRRGVPAAAAADLSARLKARRAQLLLRAMDLEAALTEARSAVQEARALGDGHDEALADALLAMHNCSDGPDDLDECQVAAEELVEVAIRLGDNERLVWSLQATFGARLRTGDTKAMDDVLERYAALASLSRRPHHEFGLLCRQAVRAFMAGRLAAGEHLIERAYQVGKWSEQPDTRIRFDAARLVVIDELQGSEETLATALNYRRWAEAGDARAGIIAAFYFHRAGDSASARESITGVLELVPTLTSRHLPLLELCLVAEVAVGTGMKRIVEELWLSLQPYAGHLVTSGHMVFGGVVDEYLGGLARAMGQTEQATEYLRGAVDRYHDLGAGYFEERAKRQLRSMEQACEPAAATVEALMAVFRRRGDGWEIGIGPHLAMIRDARGLGHLHALLEASGRDVAATELAGTHASDLAAREAHHALLDDKAKVAYRQRIRDLQEDLEEADGASDIERSARLRVELDMLLDELRRAVGLLGRDRHAADTRERARVAVRKAIATSIERIAEHDQRLASILRATVATGHHCRYSPSELAPIDWQLAEAT